MNSRSTTKRPLLVQGWGCRGERRGAQLVAELRVVVDVGWQDLLQRLPARHGDLGIRALILTRLKLCNLRLGNTMHSWGRYPTIQLIVVH